MSNPTTLEAAMMALTIFLLLGGVYLIGHAVASAVTFWSRHARAIRRNQQATYNRKAWPREERKHG